MSGGRCCWDDVTVYFEGHTGASVSLVSHTLHVSSLTPGATHRSMNSEWASHFSQGPSASGPPWLPNKINPDALISWHHWQGSDVSSPHQPAPGVPSSGDSAKWSWIPSVCAKFLAQTQSLLLQLFLISGECPRSLKTSWLLTSFILGTTGLTCWETPTHRSPCPDSPCSYRQPFSPLSTKKGIGSMACACFYLCSPCT